MDLSKQRGGKMPRDIIIQGPSDHRKIVLKGRGNGLMGWWHSLKTEDSDQDPDSFCAFDQMLAHDPTLLLGMLQAFWSEFKTDICYANAKEEVCGLNTYANLREFLGLRTAPEQQTRLESLTETKNTYVKMVSTFVSKKIPTAAKAMETLQAEDDTDVTINVYYITPLFVDNNLTGYTVNGDINKSPYSKSFSLESLDFGDFNRLVVETQHRNEFSSSVVLTAKDDAKQEFTLEPERAISWQRSYEQEVMKKLEKIHANYQSVHKSNSEKRAALKVAQDELQQQQQQAAPILTGKDAELTKPLQMRSQSPVGNHQESNKTYKLLRQYVMRNATDFRQLSLKIWSCSETELSKMLAALKREVKERYIDIQPDLTAIAEHKKCLDHAIKNQQPRLQLKLACLERQQEQIDQDIAKLQNQKQILQGELSGVLKNCDVNTDLLTELETQLKSLQSTQENYQQQLAESQEAKKPSEAEQPPEYDILQYSYEKVLPAILEEITPHFTKKLSEKDLATMIAEETRAINEPASQQHRNVESAVEAFKREKLPPVKRRWYEYFPFLRKQFLIRQQFADLAAQLIITSSLQDIDYNREDIRTCSAQSKSLVLLRETTEQLLRDTPRSSDLSGWFKRGLRKMPIDALLSHAQKVIENCKFREAEIQVQLYNLRCAEKEALEQQESKRMQNLSELDAEVTQKIDECQQKLHEARTILSLNDLDSQLENLRSKQQQLPAEITKCKEDAETCKTMLPQLSKHQSMSAKDFAALDEFGIFNAPQRANDKKALRATCSLRMTPIT